MECSIEMLEQPARKVKFRMEVHSHRCQQKELLLGRVRKKTALSFVRLAFDWPFGPILASLYSRIIFVDTRTDGHSSYLK